MNAKNIPQKREINMRAKGLRTFINPIVGNTENCNPRHSSMIPKRGTCVTKGITATAPGFFGPQGRQVRLPLRFPRQNELLESFSCHGHRVCNMEMETSALYGLGRGLGHNCLTVCVLIANRCTKDFSQDYKPHVEELVRTVLDRITR